MTAICGTESSFSDASVRSAKTNVATNSPNTDWLKRSRRNVRVTRGESCALASCSTSIVTEKTSAVKLIIAVDIADNTARALTTSMFNGRPNDSVTASSRMSASAAAPAMTAAVMGTSHSWTRKRSAR